MSQLGENEREGAEEISSRDENKGAQGADTSPLERLRAELEEAQRERDQFRSGLQRMQADYANFRKRMDDERTDFQKAAGAQVLNKLFPLLDDLERALAHAPQGDDSPFMEGMRIISKKTQSFLQEVGVQVIEPVTGKPFDPWEHEVVAYQQGSGKADGHIIGVAAKGYKLHGRVLRPAQVVVAKAAD